MSNRRRIYASRHPKDAPIFGTDERPPAGQHLIASRPEAAFSGGATRVVTTSGDKTNCGISRLLSMPFGDHNRPRL